MVSIFFIHPRRAPSDYFCAADTRDIQKKSQCVTAIFLLRAM